MSIDDTHPGAPSDLPFAEAELPWNHPWPVGCPGSADGSSRATGSIRGSWTRA